MPQASWECFGLCGPNLYLYNPHGVLLIVSGFVAAGLGLFVWLKKPGSLAQFSFFLMTISAFLWLAPFGMVAMSKTEAAARPWLLIGYLGIPFISPCAYLFSVAWLGLRHQLRAVKLAFAVGLTFSISMLFLHKHVVALEEFWWGYYDVFPGKGKLYLIPFLAFFFGVSLMGFRNFVHALRHEKSEAKRQQIKYILLALGIAYVGSLDYIPSLGFKGYPYPFGYMTVLAFVALTSYSIVKHRLLDIRIVIRRAFLISAIYIAALLVFSVFNWPLYQWVSGIFGSALAVPFLVLTGSLLFSAGAFVYAHMVQSAAFFKDRVISGVTHEFKSPLACIQSAAETLAHEVSSGRGLDARKGMLADYILMIRNNGERLERFIKDLLETSKLEQGKTQLRMESSNLDEICRKTVETYRLLAEQKGIKMEFIPNGSRLVMCDPDKIQMVVSNLVSNALKFTDRGSVRVSVETSPKEARVVVEDTGTGIPPEDLPYIFDKFYRGKNAEETKGTGLGLAIVKGWVEAHGGRVWVESKGRGEGTSFIASIPRMNRDN